MRVTISRGLATVFQELLRNEIEAGIDFPGEIIDDSAKFQESVRAAIRAEKRREQKREIATLISRLGGD